MKNKSFNGHPAGNGVSADLYNGCWEATGEYTHMYVQYISALRNALYSAVQSRSNRREPFVYPTLHNQAENTTEQQNNMVIKALPAQ